MAKLYCKCGELLSTSNVPNEVELHVFSDKTWVDVFEQEKLDPAELPYTEYVVWKCDSCQRLYLFEGDKVKKIYKVEEEF